MKQIIFMVFMVLSLHINAQNTSYLCPGTSKTLTASVSGGIAPITYTWAGPGGNTTGPTRSVNATGTYTWTATDATGCNATGTHIVNVEADPTSLLVINAVNNCLNVSQNISATGVPSGYSYSWNFGANAIPSTSTSSIQSVTYSAVGSKIITLVISKTTAGINGCDATCTFTVTKTITIGNLTGTSTCG